MKRWFRKISNYVVLPTSHGVTGGIHVTEAVYERLKHHYKLTLRGEMEIKGKGLMRTYPFVA